MNENDSPKPSTRETLAPGMGLTASVFAGTPLAVITVSLVNRTIFKAQPLSLEEAVAVGTVGAGILGYLFHVAKVLIDRAIAKVGAP